MIKGLENTSYEEGLRSWAVLGEKGRLRGPSWLPAEAVARWVSPLLLCLQRLARGNRLKLRQGRFRLGIIKTSFRVGVLRHLSKLPREVVGSPFPEVLRRCLDLAPGDVI